MRLSPILQAACPKVGNPLVEAVQRREPAIELLRLIQIRMAEIAATLGFMADHPATFNLVEDGRALSREVRMLKRMSELIVTAHRSMGPPALAAGHPEVRRVLSLLVDRVLEIGREVLPVASATAIEERLRVVLTSILIDPAS